MVAYIDAFLLLYSTGVSFPRLQAHTVFHAKLTVDPWEIKYFLLPSCRRDSSKL